MATLGYIFCPKHARNYEDVVTAWTNIHTEVSRVRGDGLDSSPSEWRSSGWLQLHAPLLIVAIHPNDMDDFERPVRVKEFDAEWLRAVAKDNPVMGESLATWVAAHPNAEVAGGFVGCVGLIAKGATLFFYSGEKIQCREGLVTFLGNVGIREGEHYFFLEKGNFRKMWQEFDWAEFLVAGAGRRLCNHYINVEEASGTLQRLLPLSILLQGIRIAATPEYAGRSPAPFNSAVNNGVSTYITPSPYWFDIHDLCWEGLGTDMRLFNFSSKLVDVLVIRLGGDRMNSPGEFLKRSLDSRSSLTAAVELSVEAFPKQVDESEVPQSRAGCLRLIWEWILAAGQPARLPECLRDHPALTPQALLALFRGGEMEYRRLCRVIPQALEHEHR